MDVRPSADRTWTSGAAGISRSCTVPLSRNSLVAYSLQRAVPNLAFSPKNLVVSRKQHNIYDIENGLRWISTGRRKEIGCD